MSSGRVRDVYAMQRYAAAGNHCPTPHKAALVDQGQAIGLALRKSATYGIAYRPYLCRCGFWHLTGQSYTERAERVRGE